MRKKNVTKIFDIFCGPNQSFCCRLDHTQMSNLIRVFHQAIDNVQMFAVYEVSNTYFLSQNGWLIQKRHTQLISLFSEGPKRFQQIEMNETFIIYHNHLTFVFHHNLKKMYALCNARIAK